MKRRPAKRSGALELWDVRTVQLADGGDDGARLHLGETLVVLAHSDGPHAVLVVPLDGDDFGLPAHMVVQAVFGHHAGEVAPQLGLFGEEVRPLVAGLEAVAVEVVGHVDARPGIAVLPPCSTRASVLLHDGERNVGLLQPNTGQDSRFAAADDDHRHLRGTVGVQRSRPARVDALEVHLLGEQRQVVVGHTFADRPVHHFPDELGRQRGRLGAAAVAIVGDHRKRLGPCPRFVFVGHEALNLVEKDPGRFEVADEVWVAGDVHQRQQQSRDADLLERGGNVGGGGGERLARVAAAHQDRSFRIIAERLRRKPGLRYAGFRNCF